MSKPVTPNDYIEYDDYYEIILTNKFKKEAGRTKVSKDKFEMVHKFRWVLNGRGYARSGNGQLLNRLIVLGDKKTSRSMVVDHINRDKLDNRNENLRLITTAQNSCNQGKRDANCDFLKMKFYDDNDMEDDENIIQAIKSKANKPKKKIKTIENTIDKATIEKYTIKASELAENFNVVHKTIMNLFHRGDIPGVRIGNAIRFSEEDVQAYLDKQSNCGQEKRA